MQTVYQLTLAATMITVLLIGGILSPRVATAATYYVAITGSDANPGSLSQPFRTIGKGVSVLAAGDTLYLREGIYTNQHVGYPTSQSVPSGTSWSNAVTIAGYQDETVTLTGIQLLGTEQYLIFDKLILDASSGSFGGIFLNCDVHHIRFQNGEVKNSRPGDMLVMGCGSNFEVLNSKIHNAAVYGFYWFGRDSLFDGNEVYDNAGYAYHIFSSGQNNVSNNIVRNNTIHGNGFNGSAGGSGGLLISCGSNNQAYNNVIYGNISGIEVGYRCTNCQVSNNTIHDNTYYGIYIGVDGFYTIVADNIVYQNGSAIDDYGIGTTLIDNLLAQP